MAGACRGLIELCASGSLGRLKSPMISAARSRWEVLGSGRCWAILLLHANEVVSSDRLIDELWGDRAPATAAKTIQVYVSKLRRALGDGWWLRARAGTCWIAIGPTWTRVGSRGWSRRVAVR